MSERDPAEAIAAIVPSDKEELGSVEDVCEASDLLRTLMLMVS